LARSQIHGNVFVSYLDGVGRSVDELEDTVVWGNVTFNHGAATILTDINSHYTGLPTVVSGNLTISSTVATAVYIGGIIGQGLVVGKNLAIRGGAGTSSVSLDKLQVGGTTTLRFGDGDHDLSVENSVFGGSFSLTTGTGADEVKLETDDESQGTTFRGRVAMNLGAGDDALTVVGAKDALQSVTSLSTFVVHHGTGSDTLVANPSRAFFPFGESIQWVV
jgi:hypothetical protein